MFDVQGFILVGGASQRMGRDKALLDFGGQPMLERIAGELSAVASAVSLVGARQLNPSFENVPDVHQQWGALGGIHAALAAARTDWAAVVACDLPFVTSELFERLATFANNRTDAVVPIQADGRPQPVCALYRAVTCLPEIERLVAVGEHTPRALLATVHARYVDFAQLRDLPGAENFFFNVNTQEDLQKAQAILSRQ
jgi:molybdopterin-guanine dinucleotide biosynthesis protein A